MWLPRRNDGLSASAGVSRDPTPKERGNHPWSASPASPRSKDRTEEAWRWQPLPKIGVGVPQVLCLVDRGTPVHSREGGPRAITEREDGVNHAKPRTEDQLGERDSMYHIGAFEVHP
jgi:hypothetical protein